MMSHSDRSIWTLAFKQASCVCEVAHSEVTGSTDSFLRCEVIKVFGCLHSRKLAVCVRLLIVRSPEAQIHFSGVK